MNTKYNIELIVRAGVCRPGDTIEMTAISAYVDASGKFALIGNFLDTVDRGRKRAYVAVRVHGRIAAIGYFLSATSCTRS